MSKTAQEIQDFLNLNNLELDNLNSNQSFKTNLLISTRNFKSLVIYLANTLSFIKNLYETINPTYIITQVLSLLENTKNILDINVNLLINTSVTQTIGTKIYRISRIDDYQIRITGDNIIDWNTDNIICQVKDINGMIVYPTIITADNKIDIYFNDLLGSNYKLFWI
jgi:hypothetical protein